MGVTSEILEQIRQGDVPEGVLPPAQDYFKYHLAFYETENALQQQNYSAAQEHLDIVLKQYPWMPYVHELQIQILMALERYDQATLWLKTLLQVRPKDTSSLFKLALCYEKQGQFTEAIALLQNLIMEFPDFSKAREALWKLYLKTKQEQVLLQEASLLIQKNSQDPKTWFWIGEAQQGLEKYSQALKSYKNALPDPSLHFEASGEIASLYLKLKNLPKAQETLKQLLEESQERLNKALIQSQRPEERALEVREATENLVETYFHCGIILEEERYYSEALHYFLTGLDQDPHHWPCQKKILEMYLLLEKKEEAFVLIQDLLQEDLLIEKKVRLASYLQEIQKESEALALLQSLAQKAPENPWVWMQYGKYFWKQGTPEKARPLFLKFLELHPKEDHYRQEIQALLQESEPEKEK